MPSISKTDSGTWKVQYYSDGKKHSKTFKDRQAAKKFADYLELTPQQKSSRLCFGELLQLYQRTESVRKRGADKEVIRIGDFLRRPFAKVPLATFTTENLQRYVDERLNEPSPRGGNISPGTIRREFAIIRTILSFAVKKKFIDSNPCKGVVLPKEAPSRERVASEDDLEKLKLASGWDGKSVPCDTTQLTILAFFLGCKTGMRSGEILQLEPAWISGNVIRLPKEATKTFSKREVALSNSASELIALAKEFSDSVKRLKQINTPRIFWPLTSTTRDALFRKVRDRAGLGPVRDSRGRVIQEGLNFHDSRATFATWAASPNPKTGVPRLDVMALARQTGHKNLKMLQRYYRASAEEIAKRLED